MHNDKTVQEMQSCIINMSFNLSRRDPAAIRLGLSRNSKKEVDNVMKTLSCMIELGRGLEGSLEREREMDNYISRN